MAAFLVLSPAGGMGRLGDERFIRDGFSWSACLFPTLWTIFHARFVDAAILLALRVCAFLALFHPFFGVFGLILLLATSLIYGFEARHRMARGLLRRGFADRGVIVAHDLAEAEAIHYAGSDFDNSMRQDVERKPSTSATQRAAELQLGLMGFERGR